MQDLQFFICLREWHGLGSVWVESLVGNAKSHWSYDMVNYSALEVENIVVENYTLLQS